MFTDRCTSDTLRYMQSNPGVNQTITMPRTGGYYSAYADELVTGCTAGEQLPWQQQTSQL